jgi:hypothetical protein
MWAEAGFAHCRFFDPQASWAETIWPHCPPSVFVRVVKHAYVELGSIPLDSLPPARWIDYLDHAPELPPGAWQLPPATDPELLTAAIRAAHRHRNTSALEHLWRRFEQPMLRQILRIINNANWDELTMLLDHCPEQAASAALAVLTPLIAEHDIASPLPSVARRWMHSEVQLRRQGWRDAYAQLADLERRLSRVRAASL